MAKLLLLASLVIAGFVAWKLTCSCKGSPPVLDVDAWWGPNELRGRPDEGVKPFSVSFGEEMIKDLRERLSKTRSKTPTLDGVTLEYGFGHNALKPVLEYWRTKYNFAERAKYLNKYPQYTTRVQGLNIHFLRIKPEVPSGTPVVPLLLLHGWPGSVREFYESIPLLTKQRPGYDFAIEVIVPSLPGYGFSEAAVRPGLGAGEMAVVMRNLMKKLGFQKFVVQGGDWGSIIASYMTNLFPDDLIGFHGNLGVVMSKCAVVRSLLGSVFPSFVVESHLAERMYPYFSHLGYLVRESGYFHLQATKPDTVGIGLQDSPAGLAAYILEKFAVWTVRDAKELPAWLNIDGMLDNIMLYWSPNSMTTSMRLYAETFNKRFMELQFDEYPTAVPTWVTQTKHELAYQPASILKLKYKNLLNANAIEKGGHFLAFELPEIFSNEVWEAVKAFRQFHRDSAKTEL